SGVGLGHTYRSNLASVDDAREIALAHESGCVPVQRIRAGERGCNRRLESVIDRARLLGQDRRVGEARFGERPTIEIAKHEAQVTAAAQCSYDGLDRIPIVAVLDVRRAWCELACKEGADLLSEGAILGIENEVAHLGSDSTFRIVAGFGCIAPESRV